MTATAGHDTSLQMSNVTKDEIFRLATLSSLAITEEEIHKRVEELNSILTYTAMMNKVADTPLESAPNNIPQTPLQADEPHVSFTLDQVIQNAPDKQDFFFKVPRMMGE